MNLEHILALKKSKVLRKYLKKKATVTVPPGISIPKDSREALLMGMHIAHRESYEDGLVDGVRLGIDVFSEAASQ